MDAQNSAFTPKFVFSKMDLKEVDNQKEKGGGIGRQTILWSEIFRRYKNLYRKHFREYTEKGREEKCSFTPSGRRPRGSTDDYIIRCLLPSSHLTGTITRYTQGDPVGAPHFPLANISQVTDFTFANFTQASSHA